MTALRSFTLLTWLSLLAWTAMLGWLNSPRTILFEDVASKDPSTGTFTIQVTGYHYGLPPVVALPPEFATGWPRTYLQRTIAFPGLAIQIQWIYINLFQNLAAAGIILFSLIRLTQEIGSLKLRDYFVLLALVAILIAIGNKLASTRELSQLETTIQLACVVPIPVTLILYVTSVLGKRQNKPVNESSQAHPNC